MCRFISFFHKPNLGDIDVAVWDMTSHGETEKALELNVKLWNEGHYTPDGKLELRGNNLPENYNEHFLRRYPNFKSFLVWCLLQLTDANGSFNGSLDVRGCNLKGVKLPTTIGCSLDVRGCDLRGVKLPTTIGGSLYVRGCDLKGVKLPTTIGGWLDVSWCDLKGVKLPTTIGGSLYVSGCDLKGVKLPTTVDIIK
jgi:uncharacterized protein YjbI with pentapeptide repeats